MFSHFEWYIMSSQDRSMCIVYSSMYSSTLSNMIGSFSQLLVLLVFALVEVLVSLPETTTVAMCTK